MEFDIHKCPDGTILKKNNIPLFLRPRNGHTPLTYTKPGCDYFEWIEYIGKNDKSSNIQGMFELIIEGKKNHDNESIDVGFLADRWDVPWQIIKVLIEEGTLSYIVHHNVRDMDLENETIRFHYEISIPLTEVYRLEEDHQSLKEIAQGQFQRISRREEKQRFRERLEHKRALDKLWFACRRKKIPIQWITDFIENMRCTENGIYNAEIEIQNIISEKDARISELEKEISSIKSHLENGNSLADHVICMRREGKNDKEIAVYLHDDGKWCTQAQVGALLHIDESRISPESMTQRARRLLGKA